MNPSIRRGSWWVLLPLTLLGLGLVNYLTGGFGEPEKPVLEVARLDYAGLSMQRTYRSETVLELPWGDSSSSVALSRDGDGEPISTLEALVPEADGGFMLVDHPSWHVGARVRRYAGDGILRETVMTPPGSTLFTSAAGKVAYIIAKQADENEQLVVRDGSTETTWVVPLTINSGSIIAFGDDFWVTAVNSEFDTENMIVTATDIAVPVVVDGRQVTDEEAAAAASSVWISVNDRPYGRTREVQGNGPDAVVTQTVSDDSNGAKLEVPGRSTVLGIDARSLVYTLMPPVELSAQTAVLPGAPRARPDADEILVGTFSGEIVGRVVIPGWMPTVTGVGRICVSEGGELLAGVGGDRSVSIVRYSWEASDD